MQKADDRLLVAPSFRRLITTTVQRARQAKVHRRRVRLRKTVAEWLDSHQKGMEMAKKKSAGKKRAVRSLPTEAAALSPKKKPVRKKAKRKRKPR